MPGEIYFGQIWFAGESLYIPAVPTVASETRVKISRVSGWDSTVVTWSADQNFTSYMFRVVSSNSDPYNAGVLIEQDQSPASGGTAGTPYTSTLTDAEVEAVSSGDGTKLVKLFVLNDGGWSA